MSEVRWSHSIDFDLIKFLLDVYFGELFHYLCFIKLSKNTLLLRSSNDFYNLYYVSSSSSANVVQNLQTALQDTTELYNTIVPDR